MTTGRGHRGFSRSSPQPDGQLLDGVALQPRPGPASLVFQEVVLTSTEQELVAATISGATLDLAGRTDRVVRASVLRRLLFAPLDVGVERVAALRLSHARVVGEANFGGADAPFSVEFSHCEFTHAVVFTKARVKNLSLLGSSVSGFKGAFLTVENTLNLSHGFVCRGQVRLFQARLGQLEAEKSQMRNPNGYPLVADYLHVSAYATFEEATLEGTVRMLGAQIDGQLDFTGARLVARPGDDSIVLDSAHVPGGVVFENARVWGRVWLVAATSDSEINFTDARLETPGESALDASSMRARKLNLSSATIAGEVQAKSCVLEVVDCTDTTLSQPGETSLDLDSTSVSGAFHAKFRAITGVLDLTNADIGIYRDQRSSWPARLKLVGARYGKLEGDEEGSDGTAGDFRARLLWLRRDPLSHPQKFGALAQAYANTGQTKMRRDTLIAGEHERRVHGKHAATVWAFWAWSMFLRFFVGYGYQPARAILWLLPLVIANTIVAQLQHSGGLIRPVAGSHTTFDALRYAVAQLFPVALLPDAKNFATVGGAAWVAFIAALVGWLLAAIVVAALTGVFRRT